ncbi:MAG: hypothetical protein V2A79_18090 [Planctomycetota bacterium]
MRNLGLDVGMGLLLLAAVPQVHAGFALGDQDRVAFFGNGVLTKSDLPMGVETFIRIRYPELKAQFRSFGLHADAILKGTVERFEKEVMLFKPTVVVFGFVTGDVPQAPFNESDFNRFKADFPALVERVKQTGARLYIMTPSCPEITKKEQLKSINYEETLAKYAEAVRAVAQEKGATVVDWFAASKQYGADHAGNKRLATTVDGVAPSVLGFAIGMTALLDAWAAEPYVITVTADWESASVSASMGQAAVNKVSDEKLELKLAGMPIPWVVPDRRSIIEEDWPGTKYYSFILKVGHVPEGGTMISEPGGKNALPYLSEQLLMGTDMGFIGPLTKLDEIAGLSKWLGAKYEAVWRQQDFMRKPLPDPEYKQAYETYYLGLEQYLEATERIVLRQPRTMNVTLEFYKVPPPSEDTPQIGGADTTTKPVREGSKKPGERPRKSAPPKKP